MNVNAPEKTSPASPVSKRRKIAAAAAGGLAAAIFAVGIWGWRTLAGTLPDYSGRESLAGLSAKVEVLRDKNGIPHIFAANFDDAARALGYVHAGERLFQMEMQRRAGAGRLAEAAGAELLPVDRLTRTLGLYRLAQSSFHALSPEAQSRLTAYAEGVNSWLDGHKNSLPPEFALLGIIPEPWQAADSLVWGKLMALQLGKNMELEKRRWELYPKLPPEKLRVLFAPMGDVPVTVRHPAISVRPSTFPKPHIMPPPKKRAAADPSPEDGRSEGIETALALLGRVTSLSRAASNAWAVSGKLTASGKPLLANDPHLGLEVPALWYLARISTPDDDIKGATVPGLPAFMLGQNRLIAWGFTNSGIDAQDLYVEPPSAEFSSRTEIIKVKEAPAVELNARESRHGPVLSDIDPRLAALAGEGRAVSLAFTGLRADDTTAEAILLLNRAANVDEAMEAMKFHQAPSQNLICADVSGNIGYAAAGLVPVRKRGWGLLPTDGGDKGNDWRGYIPFNLLPRAKNPPEGYLMNANNPPIAPSYRYWLGSDWEEPYRAMRLKQLLESTSRHDLSSATAIQMDHVSVAAQDLLSRLLGLAAANDRQKQALDLLRRWDGEMLRDRPEPLIFNAWMRELGKELFAEANIGKASDIAAALSEGGAVAALSRSLDKALDYVSARHGDDMARWRWGDEHKAAMRNRVFSRLPIFGGWANIAMPSDGDFYTLDRGAGVPADAADGQDAPFARVHGGGYRGAYDLSDPDASRFSIAGGQSGNPFSRHYRDLAASWNDGGFVAISGSREKLLADGAEILELSPE